MSLLDPGAGGARLPTFPPFQPGHAAVRALGGTGYVPTGSFHVGAGPSAATLKAISTPGFTPNYQSLLQGDPAYQAFLASQHAGDANAAAKRTAAIRALVIQYGGLPAGFTDPYGDVDPTTLALAKGNQNSTLATQARAYGQNVLNSKRALAARGALQSGDLGYSLNQEDAANSQALYNAGNAFSGGVGGAVNEYTGQVASDANGLPELIAQLLPQIRQANPATPGGQAKLVPNWQSQYGHPVYQGDDGTLWTIDPNTGQPTQFAPNTAIPTTGSET